MDTTSQTFFSKLDELIISSLQNTEIAHPKMMVTFSARPGSGKTSIALPLANKLQAIYLENDLIRKHIMKLCGVIDIFEINKILYPYLPHLYKELQQYPNGLWVIDATINQYPKEFFETANENNFKTYIIRLNISDEDLKQRIIARGDRAHATAERYLTTLELRRQEHANFGDHFKSDFVVSGDGRTKIDEIANAIQAKL